MANLPSSTSLSSGTRLGFYSITSRLGAGGMGEVYRARDERLGRDVAVKLLPENVTDNSSAIDRFTREARAASALNHPNIITIHEIGHVDAHRFIVMELVEGRPLRAMMGETFDADLIASVGSQTAKALSVAHRAGIIHRDIKPENIMVRDDGYVKVLDFGLARLISTDAAESIADTLAFAGDETPNLTQPGMIIGTIKYMSPEQARGETVSGATDIFSLGIILYEMATAQHPFSAGTHIGTMQAIISEPPIAPSRLNPEIDGRLESLILQMLEKDARRRPAASDVDRALAALAHAGSGASVVAARTARSARNTVGREKEREQARAAFDSAAASRGLILAVAGEPGIGKTTFVEDFISELDSSGAPYIIARGRCSERLAGAEAYLPLLEALDSSLRGEGSQWAARVMKQVSPAWYAQVASLSVEKSPVEMIAGERVSQERMKREFAALLEEVSRLRPLILFIDDLHWADVSTVDMLAYLAGKLASMRVLIVATYRPSDMLLAKNPFLQIKPEMIAHGACREIHLEFLSRDEIERYLALEFPDHRFPPEFPALIHARTEGNPLFMSDLARYLRDRNVIAEDDGHWTITRSLAEIEQEMPESVRGMIKRKIDQLDEEDRRLLVAASVEGYDFDSAVVARALALDPADVEERLERLERVHAFVKLVDEREFPDRTLTLRYRFVHALYQNTLYAELRPTRRASLSAAVAAALLDYYRDRSNEVAAELAHLFEAARDFLRAVDFYLVAVRSAAHVFAHAETEVLARRALKLLDSLEESDERDRKELELQLALGVALSLTKGFATSESGERYARARDLCQKMGNIAQLAPAIFGLSNYYLVAGEPEAAREMAEQVLLVAEDGGDEVMLTVAHHALGTALMYLGEITSGFEHLEKSLALYRPEQSRSYVSMYRFDHSTYCMGHTGRILWMLGYPDRARQRITESLSIAEKSKDPHRIAPALVAMTGIHKWRGEIEPTIEWGKRCIEHCNRHDITENKLWAACALGWALAEAGRGDEGIAMIQQCLAVLRSLRALVAYPHLLSVLAETMGAAGRIDEGLAAVDEGFAVMSQTGERWCESELNVIKGNLLARRGGDEDLREAEECFQKAIEVARRQQAKIPELRATVGLSRRLQAQGKSEEARERLAQIYGWFTEGFDARPLKEAKALLDDLQQRPNP